MKHSLSYFYTTLTGLETAQELTFLQAWERDLEMSFSHAQKGRILLFNQKASVASRCQEGGYKILTGWYRTPNVLHRIYPQMSDVCWRCHEAEGTILHIFWECPRIRECWEMVAETIKTITGISLGDRLVTFLLLDIPISVEKFKNSLLRQRQLGHVSLSCGKETALQLEHNGLLELQKSNKW